MGRRLLVPLDLPVRVVSAHRLTPEQEQAVGRRDGSLLVRAGAGTGKTTVLVERFARAVTEDDVAVEAILAITFTEKAAAEMKTRVRERFLEVGRRAEARAAEGAWISTIHGFCSRVLRAHALSAGIDPAFRVLDELEAERIATDAFDSALGAFMADGEDPERLEMVAAYTPDRLRDMVRTAHSRLRSEGERRPRLQKAHPPSIGDERSRLERAVRSAAAELGAETGPVKAVTTGLECLERSLAVLERLPVDELAHPTDLGKLELKKNANALRSDACEEYRTALDAYAGLCRSWRQFGDHTMLRALLELYDGRYEKAKRARSGLDFEDLELITRDLLRDDEGLRGQYSERFAHVLVDEFQDVNDLQDELIGQLDRDNVFRVGDENQSIYGFRNADVEVFRAHWTQAAERGRAESITVNFRSRGELLEAIDRCFEGVWGDEFEPLRESESARARPPRLTPSVELLVTDKHKGRWEERLGSDDPFGAAMHSATLWRAAEARLLAKRIEQLHGDGGWEWRDMVMLLRATTSMGFYERALEERGIPTHVVGGRGYWSQQQVADLRHWLAALANPRDGLAVYSVLASPLAGLSLDAVALIGLHARRERRHVWWAITDPGALANDLPDGDRRRLARFVEMFDEERRTASLVSLETLIDRAVTRTGYDHHVLSMPGGTRRMANVRKLMRMAREYEADEGPDLRGFIDTLDERDAVQPREGEAPLEAEALDAVRLMTIHRAKGLEFPVVCVGDLGKDGREDYGALRISDDGSLGLRLASIGGGAVDSAELERIKAEQKREGEEEEKRIFYVAVTRAQEHLVLSGATDLDTPRPPEDMKEPMRWMLGGFAGAGVREIELRPENVDDLLPEPDRRPLAPEVVDAGEHAQPELGLAALPAPRALAVSRLSYSSLEDYRRCSYRFYLERALRLPRVDRPPAADPPQEAGLGALLRGTIVHQLLERIDFERPGAPPEAEVSELIESHGAVVRPAEVEDLGAMVERFAASELCARIARAQRVRTELPFAFTLSPEGAGGRSLLVNGVLDVHAAEEDRLLVVDYKSDALEGRDPAELTSSSYSTQRLVYGLAGLRSGVSVVEVAHCYLERPGEPASVVYEAGDEARLEAELLELARGVVEGHFFPAENPHRELCGDCPGRAKLCSWPPQRTLQAGT